MMSGLAFVALSFLCILVLCLFPYTFVWYFLANEPENQRNVFRRNFALLKGRKKLFWKIIFRAIGSRIVLVFVIWAIMFVLTQISLKNQSSALSLFSTFFNLLYIYMLYSTQAFAFLLLPIIYDLFLEDSVENQVDVVEIRYSLPDNSGDLK